MQSYNPFRGLHLLQKKVRFDSVQTPLGRRHWGGGKCVKKKAKLCEAQKKKKKNAQSNGVLRIHRTKKEDSEKYVHLPLRAV